MVFPGSFLLHSFCWKSIVSFREFSRSIPLAGAHRLKLYRFLAIDIMSVVPVQLTVGGEQSPAIFREGGVVTYRTNVFCPVDLL